MKRIFYLILFIIIIPLSGYSLRLDVGGNIGFGFGTVDANGTNQNLKTHFGLGGNAELYFLKFLSVDLGLRYQIKGASLSGNSLALQYLEIPMLFRFYFYKGFWVGAGTYLGIHIHGNYPGDNTYSSADSGFLFGVGEKFALNEKENLYLTANFIMGYGLKNVLTSLNGTYYNRTYMINFGLMAKLF